MRRILIAAALSIATVLAVAPGTASANDVAATINCERWSFHYSRFPQGHDVVLSVAVTVPQGEGALVSTTVHTDGKTDGDAHGDFDVPVRHTVTLTVTWTLDGAPHTVIAHSPTICSPPETPTTTTSTTTTLPPPLIVTSSTSTTTTTAPATTVTSVPPADELAGTGADVRIPAAIGGTLLFVGWCLLRRRPRTA